MRQVMNTLPERPARGTKSWRHNTAVAIIVLSLILAPRQSLANFTDCEFPFLPWIVSAVLLVIQTAAIYDTFWPPDGGVPSDLEDMTKAAMDGADCDDDGTIDDAGIMTGNSNRKICVHVPVPLESVFGSLDFTIDTSSVDFDYGGLQWMDEMMRGRLDKFWVDLQMALEGMSTQLYSSAVNVARIMSSNADAEALSKSEMTRNEQELKAKDNSTVTEEACVFDTVAKSAAVASKTTTAIAAAMSNTHAAISGNRAGSASATGRGGFIGQRFANYASKFCDPNANGGNSPCTTAGSMPNADIMPSRTLFEKPTIDMTNDDTRTAVNELVYNLTGYIPTETIPETALESAEGKEIRQVNREYAARMDAVSGLIWGIVGERAPGPKSQEIQDLRLRAGASNPSLNPSEREVRQAIVEQLWDPKYYANLGDSVNTISQKDLYLKAYSSVLLHKMIEKTERISTVYAIETADLLRKMPGARMTTIQLAPLQ